MTDRYSTNYNRAYVTNNTPIARGEVGGKVKVLYDEYALPDAVTVINDEINLLKLPKNARIVDAVVSSPSMGGTGKFSLGWKASVDTAGDAVAEDLDGIIDEIDAGAAAITEVATSGANLAGLGKKFGDQETQLILKVTEASTATSGTVKIIVKYISD